jgi:hypothetical protein
MNVRIESMPATSHASPLNSCRACLARAQLAAVLIAAYICLATGVQRAAAAGPDVIIHDGPTFRIAQRESDPAPAPTSASPAALTDCKPFELEPLSSLIVDVSPTGEPPDGCFSYAMGEPPAIFLGGGPRGPACDLLQICCGWQFCHRPLYFEERCLERYGCRTCCCQPAASAIHFYGTALLLPLKMIQQPCCRASVRTPCY